MNWDDVIVDAAATDKGMRRAQNEDSWAVVRAPSAEVFKSRGHLFMVADGMGAHAVGELASKLACDYIPHTYHKTKSGPPADALIKAYLDVGAQIFNKAAANPDFHRMGTTCTTLVLLPAGALVAHVGDSRVYRVRQDRIDQLSFDHSMVWELVKKGHVDPAEAQRAYPRNVITRSLGPEPTVQVDIEGPHVLEPGDVFVLCSDGLSGPVTDPEIGAIAANLHPTDACRVLIDLANLRGGPDNITVIVIRIGPWVNPGEDGHQNAHPHAPAKARGSFLSGLLGSLRPRAPVDENVRDPYQSASCAIDESLTNRLAEEIRSAQAIAVDHAWTLDWPALTRVRKASEEAVASHNPVEAFRHQVQAISLLGQAGRQAQRDSRHHNGV